MSVINNMLKDLETRSSQFTPIEIATVGSAVAPKPKSTSGLTVTLVTTLLAVGLIFLYFQFPYSRGDAVTPVKAIVDATSVPVAPARTLIEPEVAPVNQIIGLQMKETVDNLSLQFSLREKVISYLKERSENRFVYHLKDIRSEIVAPKIRDNRWIEQLSISPRDQGVDIIFRTTSSVLVETREQRQDGEQIWSIKLMKLPQPVATAQPTETSPKAKAAPPVKKSVQPIATYSHIKVKPETPATPNVEARGVKLDIKSSQPQLSTGEKLQRATVLIKKRRWQEAEILLKGLIDGPQDLAARTQLLGIYRKNGQTGRFSALVRESIKRYPQQSLFKTEYARSLYKLDAYQSVIALLQNTDDADATQLALLAASYQRLEQHQQAVRYYKQSLDKNGRQARIWIGLGISQEQTAQLEGALKSYRMATMLGNLNTRLQTFVGKRTRQLEQTLN